MSFSSAIRSFVREPMPLIPGLVYSKADVVHTPLGRRFVDRLKVGENLDLRWPPGAFSSPPCVQLQGHKASVHFSVSGISDKGCVISCRRIGSDEHRQAWGEVTVVAWEWTS